MIFLASIIALLSLLVISFSSPLFAILGFEYSTIMALALSLVCGISATIPKKTKSTQWAEIREVILDCLLVASVPLVISILSLPFIPNCSFWDGLVFYLEIGYPSALLGGLFGLACSWLLKKRSKAVFLFIGFWIITLFLSFLPGYLNPQLYTYGWQYGFFPGIVWDESLELTNSYLIFRIENITWVILVLLLAYGFHSKRRANWWVLILSIITTSLFFFNDEFHITTSHNAVEKNLKNIVRPVSNCTIYYAPGSLSSDELEKIERDVRWYLDAIKGRFELQPPKDPIRIYIYPSSDAMFSLIGTRTASISKPWLGEVHIAKENLESLKHELTHVLLREKGVFPFYVSWSTGLTEGAAMSVEPEYDGIYTLDEHAARILQMHYANGVKEVMSFTGFAANASQKSYVLAGSFSRYLLSTYGPTQFNHVYASLDWKKEYRKPLDSLESEWQRWLAPMMTPMDADDSEHFRYYYDRASIIYNPCLRRIGKLNRQGHNAYLNGNYSTAQAYYRSALNAGGGIESLIGLSNTFLRQNDLSQAISILDTTHNPIVRKQNVVLDLRRADLQALTGNTLSADSLYTVALAVKVSSGTFLSAYAHKLLLHSDVGPDWIFLVA